MLQVIKMFLKKSLLWGCYAALHCKQWSISIIRHLTGLSTLPQKQFLRCVHYNQLFNIYTKQSHHVTCLVKSQLTSTNNAFIMKKRLPSAFLSSVDFQPTTMLGIAVYRH